MSPSNYSIRPSKTSHTQHKDPHELLPRDRTPDMVAALTDSFRTGDYGPYTVRCGGREWSILRTIVFTKSRVFEKIMDERYKEASTRVIELPDDDPVAVNSMIVYMYTNIYSASIANTSSFEVALQETTAYALAEKYDIKGMKLIAKSRFRNAIFSDHSNLFLTMSPNEALSLVDSVYTTTPDTDLPLRDTVVDAIRDLAFNQPLMTLINLSSLPDVYVFCADVAITLHTRPHRQVPYNGLRSFRSGFEEEIVRYLLGLDLTHVGRRSRMLCQGLEPLLEVQKLVKKRWDEGFSEYDIVRHWFSKYYELVTAIKPVVVERTGDRRYADVDQPFWW